MRVTIKCYDVETGDFMNKFTEQIRNLDDISITDNFFKPTGDMMKDIKLK
jgi:hypothetical protein